MRVGNRRAAYPRSTPRAAFKTGKVLKKEMATSTPLARPQMVARTTSRPTSWVSRLPIG